MFKPSAAFPADYEVGPLEESANSTYESKEGVEKPSDQIHYAIEGAPVLFREEIDEGNELEDRLPDTDWLFTSLDNNNEIDFTLDCVQHRTSSNLRAPPAPECNTCTCINCVEYIYGGQSISASIGEPQWPYSNSVPFGSPSCMLTSSNDVEMSNVLLASMTNSPSITSSGLSLESDEEMPNTNEHASKTGPRFSREAIRILREWLSSHRQHPYPSDDAKEGLMQKTGLKKSQVTNWLTNARRRYKGRRQVGTNSEDQNSMAQSLVSPTIYSHALSPMANTSTSSSHLWADPPPDSSGLENTDEDIGNSTQITPYSGSLVVSQPSNDLNLSYLLGSLGKTKQKHRRGSNASNILSKKQVPEDPRIFECTFCTKTFKTKHDWQRHELLHLPLEQWICALHGSTFTTQNSVVCTFCGLRDPSPNHIEERHNYTNCAEQSLKKRLFYRKDHLRQHLRGVHQANLQDQILDSWKISAEGLQSRCGLCGITINSWSVRAEHLSDHFKLGKTMADWKGEWGFESRILELVNDAIPPDLIHEARSRLLPGAQAIEPLTGSSSSMHINHVQQVKKVASSPKPLSGYNPPSRAGDTDTEPSNMDLDPRNPDSGEKVQQLSQTQKMMVDCYPSQRALDDPNTTAKQYANLTQQLSRYISTCMSANNPRCHIPTDAEIQHQARLIVYDDDGPSKHTPADNAEWLLLLKTACGLME